MTVNANLGIDIKYKDASVSDKIVPFLSERAMKILVQGINFNVIPLGETKTADGKVFGASLGIIFAGERIPTHVHHDADAVVHILSGRGKAIYGEKSSKYCAGMAFEIPANVRHGFVAEEDTIFYATQKNNGIINRNGDFVDIDFVD